MNYSAASDGPTDRRANRETEHQLKAQTDSETARQEAVDHQNFPPGTFLFIINTSIEFYINLYAFTVPGF